MQYCTMQKRQTHVLLLKVQAGEGKASWNYGNEAEKQARTKPYQNEKNVGAAICGLPGTFAAKHKNMLYRIHYGVVRTYSRCHVHQQALSTQNSPLQKVR